MFGTNTIEKRRHHHDGLSLNIVDVFSTIQGEGPHAGVPATFVRLAGCHLRCYFCDTDFTSHRREVLVENLVEDVVNRNNTLVVLTGGEPLRQNILPLAIQLQRWHHTVQVETAGHFWWDELDTLTELVVSPKTPVVHPEVRKHAIAWKYILDDVGMVDPVNGLPCSSTQPTEHPRDHVFAPLAVPPVGFPSRQIYIQPCDLQDDLRNRAAVKRAQTICMEHGYRLSLQLHKILGLP